MDQIAYTGSIISKESTAIKHLKINYTNHRNETAERTIVPITVWHGTTEWHPVEQWFLKATDVEREVERDFAMVQIGKISEGQARGKLVDNDISAPEQLMHTQPAGDKLVKAKLFADGGSRGNPGPAASGYVIVDMADNVVKSNGIYIGVTTNNQAEYKALEAGLRDALELGVKELHVYLDSLLVVNQVQGIWKIKNADFMPLYHAIHKSLKQFDHVSIGHVPRALNKLADEQVNICLDAQ